LGFGLKVSGDFCYKRHARSRLARGGSTTVACVSTDVYG
jgi:hypothetical protein